MKKSKNLPINVTDIEDFIKLRISQCQENAFEDVVLNEVDDGETYDYSAVIDTLNDILEFITTNGFKCFKK